MRTKSLTTLIALVAIVSMLLVATLPGLAQEGPTTDVPVEVTEEPPVEQAPEVTVDLPVEPAPEVIEEAPVAPMMLMAAPLDQGQNGTTLTADKTAVGYWQREYHWTISKSVTPAAWNLFVGDSGTSTYTVTVTKDAGTDTVWVAGQICVTNGGAVTTENLTIFDHVQYKTGSGQFQELGASTTIVPAPLGPGETGCYDYTIPFTPVAGAAYRNVATITITNHSGHLGEPFGPEPKADFSLPGSPTLINDSINVSDSFAGSLGAFNASGSATYNRTFTCGDSGTYGNTATIDQTGQSASASVTVACYALRVTKDAATAFDRTYNWTIDKTGDQSALTLSTGQQFLVNYTTVLSATYTDSDWAVEGAILIYNPAPMDAPLTAVSDVVSPDILADVDCPSLVVPAGGSLTCTYGTALPNASDRLNTATATLQNYAYASTGAGAPSGTTGFSGTANVSFGNATMTEYDECIEIADDRVGSLGTLCYPDAPRTFHYSLYIGPYDTCGTYEFVNVASFVTNNTGAAGSDSWTVTVNVPCGGCTLTPGYWKTHSAYGPARWPDATWALIGGPDTAFFQSGKSWYQVLWTPPSGGNAYYILAHAYIAARLNILNGAATTPAVDTALAWATGFFSTNTPASNLSKTVRNQATTYAALLDSYNNGAIGPGHCNE